MHTTLIAAQSLDGFITRHDQPGTAFTSAADQAHFSAELAGYDCSVVGASTYRFARDFIRARVRPGRRRMVLTRSPEKWTEDVIPGLLEFTDATPESLAARLAEAGCRRCALLGGAQIHRLYFEAGLVDELVITIEPRLFASGTPIVPGKVDIALELLSVIRLPHSDSLVVRYVVKK